MQQPPDQYPPQFQQTPQWPQQHPTYYPQQQNTGYLPWTQVPPSPQDQFTMPPQQQMQPWLPQQPQYYPPQPPKKNTRKYLVFGFAALVVLVFLVMVIAAIASYGGHTSSSTLSEPDYKASTTDTTVATLDKDSNNDKGKDVHFTATVLSFVKDSNGNTAGANVDGTNAILSGIVQIVFPQGMDLSKVNQGDTVEVWGTDNGDFSGTNAFGATVHEVGVSVLYLTDQTTGYQTA